MRATGSANCRGRSSYGKLSTLFETTYCENRPRNLAGCPWKSPATHVDTDLFVGYSIDNRRAALGRPFGKVLWQ
jgi:hypothetical protein